MSRDEAKATESLATLFAQVDVNANGKLEYTELTRVFGEFADQFLEFCDQDKDKEITVEEWTAAIIKDTADLSEEDFQAQWVTRMTKSLAAVGANAAQAVTTQSEPLAQYAQAFANPDEPFLTYHNVNPDKTLTYEKFTRGEFWNLACKAAGKLSSKGLRKGDHVLHFFSGNRVEDLAFRLGAVMVGTVPVTVNWQADSCEKVLYKAESTEAKLCVCDSGVLNGTIDGLPEKAVADALTAAGMELYNVASLTEETALESSLFDSSVSMADTRMVIFTSGTTGNPKGVMSSYTAYYTNRATFEKFLQLESAETSALFILINPMHHTNSSAITDWALRRPGCELHLSLKYSTKHWTMLQELASSASEQTRVICPMVSKHFDFLESLIEGGKLDREAMKLCLTKAEPLIGSAPVGPSTVERLQKYGGRLPHVRFGSTETCLQVTGTPLREFEPQLKAYQAGWAHTWNDEPSTGYFIGRHHPPLTQVKVVKSVAKNDECFMEEVSVGQSGYLVCKGDNVMKGYVKNPEATAQALTDDGWYLNFGDICFQLEDPTDHELNTYWKSRDSAMLIRGGSNYAYEQVQGELNKFMEDKLTLQPNVDFELAVVGVNFASEHEDECYLTVDLKSDAAKEKQEDVKSTMLEGAGLPKWAKPQFVRFGEINKNFKGAVLCKDLKQACIDGHTQ